MRFRIPAIALVVLTAGCSGSEDYVPPDSEEDPELVACMDALEADLQEIDEAEVVTVDWSQVTEDLDGNPLDPAADIDQLVVAFLDLTVEQVAEVLCRDSMAQSDVVLLVEDNTVQGSTSAELDASSTAGTVAGVTLLGGGTVRAMAIVEVTAGLANTVVTVSS